MAVEGLRAAAPTAAPAPARARPSAEAADGTGFGAALAACESEDAATVAQEAETATDLAEPVKDKVEGAAQTVADAPVAVEVPTGDAAWLPPAVELPRQPDAPPTPAPASARGVGAVGPAESGPAARTASALQPLATSHDAATPPMHPAPVSAAEAPTATPAAALLLQQHRIAQRDAAAAAEPSTRPAATALAPQRPGAELQALPALGLLSPEAQGLPRRWERATASAGPVAGTGPSPVAGADASNPSPYMAPVDAAAAGASLGHPGLAERMTEQMSWWMAQKTQGAELSMAIDGRPVSVSVRLQGHEAQVVFRSDQPEARQMLAQALPELEQMFGNEGLLLSQASVGSQAQGRPGQGGQAAPPRGERTPGAGLAPVGAAEARPRVMALRADGSRPLDLYV